MSLTPYLINTFFMEDSGLPHVVPEDAGIQAQELRGTGWDMHLTLCQPQVLLDVPCSDKIQKNSKWKARRTAWRLFLLGTRISN